MDKKLKSLLKSTLVIFLIILVIFIFNISAYIISNIMGNEYLFYFVIMLFSLVIFILFILAFSVFIVYKKDKPNKLFIRFSIVFNKAMMPILTLVDLPWVDKELVRSFFVDVNNKIVKSGNYKYKPNEILIIVPHCLQNSECNLKITNQIENCKNCGNCVISDIKNIAKEYKVNVMVATGGTAARATVKKFKPKLIVSVACERDLASGIMDIKSIPVVGIINLRPQGPCFNTTVDYKLLKDALEKFIV